MSTEHDPTSSGSEGIVDTAMLDRYFAGESSREERVIVERWIAADVGRAEWVSGIRDAVTLAFGAARVDVQQGLDALERRIGVEQLSVEAAMGDAPGQTDRPNAGPWNRGDSSGRQVLRTARRRVGVFSGRPLRRNVWYVAVGLLLGAVGIVIGRNERLSHGIEASPSMVSTYATANGERANITLPDGSTVALNVASRLDVPVDYAAGNHTVHLFGEALFTVTHHGATPLTVISGMATVRVLGTSFAVRHYATDTTATVAVRDGKVMVGNVVLTAARMIDVGPLGTTAVRPAAASRFSFASGVLTIDSMPVAQAVPEFDRWYGVDIRFGDPSLRRVQIEGKFPAGSVSDLTEFLQYMLNARVVRDGRTLTLYPNTSS